MGMFTIAQALGADRAARAAGAGAQPSVRSAQCDGRQAPTLPRRARARHVVPEHAVALSLPRCRPVTCTMSCLHVQLGPAPPDPHVVHGYTCVYNDMQARLLSPLSRQYITTGTKRFLYKGAGECSLPEVQTR